MDGRATVLRRQIHGGAQHRPAKIKFDSVWIWFYKEGAPMALEIRFMTVCIAAICQNGIIFGASDRMMTSGDIEFEPKLDSIAKPDLSQPLDLTFNANTKIYPITNSVVVMTAGDSGLQSEIVQDMLAQVQKSIQQNPHWLYVKEAVGLYLDAYEKAKSRRAHQKIFAPYGFDMQTFLEKSNQLSNHLVIEINKQIQRFDSYFAEMHGIETIITGVDATFGNDAPSAHIYSIVKSSAGDFITCGDSVGFAAVGSGARHAESQFMLAGHSPFASSPETLLLTYLSKKRSEVAPGVGKGTDMFTIGPTFGSFAMLENIKDFDMKQIESIYDSVDEGQKKAFEEGMNKTKDYITKLFNERNEKQLKVQKEQESQLKVESATHNPTAVLTAKPAENKTGSDKK